MIYIEEHVANCDVVDDENWTDNEAMRVIHLHRLVQ